MREIFNFLNFEKKKKKRKRNIEVSKIFNFGNLKNKKSWNEMITLQNIQISLENPGRKVYFLIIFCCPQCKHFMLQIFLFCFYTFLGYTSVD